MSAADSIKVGPLTSSWQNAWELANAKFIADGVPTFEKFARTLNLEAPRDNTDAVYWARTSLGDNPAGSLLPGESIQKLSGGNLQNENLYTIYLKGDGQYILIERTQ